jgi:predicted  nucleic acid-binding Zn-ribbon protein
MGAKLQALRELQDVELQIVDIQRQLAQKERAVAAQRKKLDAALSALENDQSEIRRLQVEFDENDVDVKARSGHVTRLREHLNSVRTNKEYAAVLAQLNNEKADMARLENRGLEMMTRIDDRRTAHSEQEKAVEAEKRRLADLQAQLELARGSFSSRQAQLCEARARCSAAVDPVSLALFERLSERYDGEVLAEVVKPNARRDEFICGGCNMTLRIEVANTLRTRDDVLHCKSCGRILYLNK